MRVVSHQGGLLSTYQGGLSSGWYFVRVVSHQGGLLSSYQGGLSAGWSQWSFLRMASPQSGGLSLMGSIVLPFGSIRNPKHGNAPRQILTPLTGRLLSTSVLCWLTLEWRKEVRVSDMSTMSRMLRASCHSLHSY